MKKIKEILLFFSKRESDKRKLVEYKRIKKVVEEYSDEQLMAEYFDVKTKIEYIRNINNLFIIGIILVLLTNAFALYSGYIKSVTSGIVTTSDIVKASDMELINLAIILSGVLFICVVFILFYIGHAKIKSLSEKTKLLMFIEEELKRRKK